MRIVPSSVILAIAVSSFVALGTSSFTGTSSVLAAAEPSRQVSMMDACDGPSFNFFIGPDTCARNGGVAFLDFIAQLEAHQFVGAWHNAPAQTDAWQGDSLRAVNKGGEFHTFTFVNDFGPGVVPDLNDLLGYAPGAPPVSECAAEPLSAYVPPGGSNARSLDQAGEVKFQCCIHPWMKTTVLVKSH